MYTRKQCDRWNMEHDDCSERKVHRSCARILVDTPNAVYVRVYTSASSSMLLGRGRAAAPRCSTTTGHASTVAFSGARRILGAYTPSAPSPGASRPPPSAFSGVIVLDRQPGVLVQPIGAQIQSDSRTRTRSCTRKEPTSTRTTNCRPLSVPPWCLSWQPAFRQTSPCCTRYPRVCCCSQISQVLLRELVHIPQSPSLYML